VRGRKKAEVSVRQNEARTTAPGSGPEQGGSMATHAARPHYLRWMVSFPAIVFLDSILLGGVTGCGGEGRNGVDNENDGGAGSAGPGPVPDPAPLALTAMGGDGEAILQWTDVDRVDGYTLYNATEGGVQPDTFGI